MTTKAITRGRPQSNNTHCKICGQQLIIGVNARETSKGSGRPRNKCNKCENVGRYQRRNPKPTQLVFDIPESSEIHNARLERGLPRIERITLDLAVKWRPPHSTTIYYERTNPVGMTVQVEKPYTVKEKWKEVDGIHYYRNSTYFYYQDEFCDECGGKLRYDERRERVCEKCGLVHGEAIAPTDADMRGWGSVKETEWRSKNGPRLWWGRDGEHDRRDADDSRQARDNYYSRARKGEVVDTTRLKLERLLATGQSLRRPPR